MTTETEQVEQAQMAAWESAPYVQWGIPAVPFSAIRIPLVTDPVEAAAWADRGLKMAVYLARKYAEAFPATSQPEAAQPRHSEAQQPATDKAPPRGGQQRQRGGKHPTRPERYELYAGESCDTCGGPVGVYPQTGKMRSAKLVCLGRCRDDQYVHTVRWLDDDAPSEMPF